MDSYFLLSFFFTLFFFINSHLRVGETAPSSSLETVVRLGRVEDEGLEVKPIIRPDAIHHKDTSAPIGAYVDVKILEHLGSHVRPTNRSTDLRAHRMLNFQKDNIFFMQKLDIYRASAPMGDLRIEN